MNELEEKLERIEKKLEEIYSLVKRGSDMSHANLMTIVKAFDEYNAPFYKGDKREKLKKESETLLDYHQKLVELFMSGDSEGGEKDERTDSF